MLAVHLTSLGWSLVRTARSSAHPPCSWATSPNENIYGRNWRPNKYRVWDRIGLFFRRVGGKIAEPMAKSKSSSNPPHAVLKAGAPGVLEIRGD